MWRPAAARPRSVPLRLREPLWVSPARAATIADVTAGGAGLKRNAMSDGRSLAGFCEAARVRGASCFPRDTLDPAGRRDGG